MTEELDAQQLAELGRRCGRTLAGSFAFGDSPELQDELLAFVTSGSKRATAGSVVEIEAANEPLPEPGMCWGILDGAGAPRYVIETTQVRIGRLDSVDPAFAWDEGEYDRTRESWLDGHLRYFARQGVDDPSAEETTFERFRVVWPEEDVPIWLTEGVRQIDVPEHAWAAALLQERHGGATVATPGGALDPRTLPALVAEDGGRPVGLLTFRPRAVPALAPLADRPLPPRAVPALAPLADRPLPPRAVSALAPLADRPLRPRPGVVTDVVTVDVVDGAPTGMKEVLLEGIAELGRREGWSELRLPG